MLDDYYRLPIFPNMGVNGEDLPICCLNPSLFRLSAYCFYCLPETDVFLNGEHDGLFPVVGVKAAFEEMHKVWKEQSADERLKTELWNMPHDCGVKVQRAILDFFDKWLK